MGIYLNPGKQRLQIAMNSEIFIDKSGMIRYLNSVVNTNQRFISVSRPRRFGKTMAADMICAYYDRTADSREMFEKLKLAEGDSRSEGEAEQTSDPSVNYPPSWDQYLNQFEVIRIVMTDFIRMNTSVEDALRKMSARIIRDLSRTYSEIEFDQDDLAYSMDECYHHSGNAFVIIIDEWDAIFRMRREDRKGHVEYLNFLRDWLKDKDYIALAYMTGILPIKKYGEHSALNMFSEFSMTAPMQLAPYTGFTEDEVSGLCRRYGRDYAAIKDWYDGYLVSDIVPADPGHELLETTGSSPMAKKYSLYSPLSVVNAVSTGLIRNYWNSTESYEALAEYIRMDYDGLKNTVALLMDGGRVKVDLSTYQNDMTTFHNRDDILALLIHLGYLGYDSDSGEVFIPNKEILDVFKSSTKSSDWTGTFREYAVSEELLKATWAMDEKKAGKLMEWFHDQASNQSYNDEAALSYAIQLAYYAAEKYYTKVPELDTGKGYADVVYLPSPKYPDKPAMLIELKYDHDVQTAADQIRSRNYPQRLEHYKGNTLLVSINYDKDTSSRDSGFKHHTCRIEKV